MKLIIKYLWFLLGVFAVMYASFYNGFPLVTSDSGVYIFSGFENFVPADRPATYGIFVRHSSLSSSLWFTIIFQAVIISYILWQILNRFTIKSIGKFEKFIIIIFLVTFSSLSWYSSQIMPDIFLSIGVLAFLLLVLPKNGSINTFFNSIILLFSSLVHNSHLLIFSILVVLLVVYAIYDMKYGEKLISFTKSIFLFFLILLTWVLSPTINYLINDQFSLGGSPNAFLIAKNIENGIVDRYLDENCDKYLMKTLPDSGLYFISPKISEKFLDIEGVSKLDDANLQQWDYTGGENQQFYIIKVKNEWYKIISKNSNKCIEVQMNDTNYAKQIVQKTYSGKDNQLFKFEQSSDSNCFNIVSKENLKVLDVEWGRIENYVKIILFDHTGNDNQKFKIIKYPHCLCLFKDRLPSSAVEFLWANESIFSKTGSFASSKIEYQLILNEILFSFNYLGANIGESIVATLSQLTRNEIGDGIFGMDQNSSPYGAIKKHFSYEIKTFNNSKVNKGWLNFTDINKRNFWVLLISLITIISFLSKKTLRILISKELLFLIKFCLASILVNAFVTGSLANVLDRLQARISWFFPLIAILLFVNYIIPLVKTYLGKIKLND